MPKMLPAKAYLRERFAYDPQTGILTWKNHPDIKTGRRNWLIGRPVGCKSTGRWNGLQTILNNTHYLVHRIIWKWMTGAEPPEIDHIDRDPTNNRWDNLRAATRKTNANNRMGHGVHPSSIKGKPAYRARIAIAGKNVHLGTFPTIKQARAAYISAKKTLHGVHLP